MTKPAAQDMYAIVVYYYVTYLHSQQWRLLDYQPPPLHHLIPRQDDTPIQNEARSTLPTNAQQLQAQELLLKSSQSPDPIQ